MTVTAKDLRFNIASLFASLEKGEEIIITHRGKPKAKLMSSDTPSNIQKDDAIFGIWRDKIDDVDIHVRNIRRGRVF